MPLLPLLAIAFGLAAMPPLFAATTRESVKKMRREMILAVDDFFYCDTFEIFGERFSIKSQDDPVRSLEFLKFKYSVERDRRFEILPHEWFVPAFILALLLTPILAGALILGAELIGVHVLSLPCAIADFIASHRSPCLVLIASIGGAYTYMNRAFLQAVQNFDLAPASFFGAASNLVFAIAVTQIATFHLAEQAEGSSIGTGLLMVTAFVGAYMPDDILRYFLSISIIRQLKQERSDFGSEIQTIPIEVLDGIDGRVRYRLTDFQIESVQSLASANPLMLFVETPFGFYQTLDWVAQAQLCASVGPDATFKLWRLGIRTIFDLERAVLCEGFDDVDLMQAIEHILLPELVSKASPWSPDAIVANVRIRTDGSDTRRLRQIVNRVNERLGQEATRLDEG